MKLDPAVFWQMSLREWLLAQRGFFEARNFDYRTGWEQARLIGFWAGNMGWKKGTKANDLIKFEWEKKEIVLPTEDEMRYWMLKYGKFTDEKGNGYNA